MTLLLHLALVALSLPITSLAFTSIIRRPQTVRRLDYTATTTTPTTTSTRTSHARQLSQQPLHMTLSPKTTAEAAAAAALLGSIVTIDCETQPQGDFIPEPLLDISGRLTFVLGGGNYLPGLHDVIRTMQVGETVEQVTLDAGWGSRNPNLVATIQKKEMNAGSGGDGESNGQQQQQINMDEIQVGVELYLVNGMKAVVTNVTEDTFTIDANPPLAGASYTTKVSLISIEDGPTQLEYTPGSTATTTSGFSKYKVATFALGCFWGGELEFMRLPGVVGTKVGYTQGTVIELPPTYQDVCSGTTGHTEAILVTYDPSVVTYRQLVMTAMTRLGENKFLFNQVGNDRGTQYRHGIYYHDDVQQEIAKELIRGYGPDCKTEVIPASKFWDAEPYHQQYLLKGGQSARKNDTTPIRCYG